MVYNKARLFLPWRYRVSIGTVMRVLEMPLQRRGIKDKQRHGKIYADTMEIRLDPGLDAIVVF